EGKRSGLKEVQHILKGVKGIAFIQFTESDVVRHRLVQRIIEAYDKSEKQRQARAEKRKVKEND
ncbi:MAG: PhoH family protein, partial [Eubacterium sp.]